MALRGPAPQALRRARSASLGWEIYIGPFVSKAVIRLFEILQMFYLRMGWMGRDGCYTKNVLHFTSYFLGKESYIGPFVSDSVIRLFEILKIFYPPKGTEGGPIVFTYIVFWVRKCILNLSFQWR